ncbi:MAG TPA: hypothetical protein VMU39_03730 [Solirubrobacteraceae bacterium]|nr:hypothetical protein [Solirubrobacteraceae bacterium]
MRTTHTLSGPPAALRRTPPRRPPRRVWALSHLLAPRIDRELAAGVPSWSSPAHAARSLQLSSPRSRRALAESLERLAEDARKPRMRVASAVIPPCRDQVRDAFPLIGVLADRLRSAMPVDSRGMARLRRLLCDSAGPCYAQIDVDALTIELEVINALLDVRD